MKLNKAAIGKLMVETNQKELANKLGVSSSCLSKAINGRSNAGRKLLKRLVQTFPGVNVADLVDDG